MHEKPEPTPLGWPMHSSTTQPAIHTANPIKTSMRYTTDPSDYNF
jgi:hypothetical protein